MLTAVLSFAVVFHNVSDCSRSRHWYFWLQLWAKIHQI